MNYITFKKSLIAPGKRVVSYPNHKVESLTGEIVGLDEETNELRVNYVGLGNVTLKPSGRLLSENVDTCLDVNLIEG